MYLAAQKRKECKLKIRMLDICLSVSGSPEKERTQVKKIKSCISLSVFGGPKRARMQIENPRVVYVLSVSSSPKKAEVQVENAHVVSLFESLRWPVDPRPDTQEDLGFRVQCLEFKVRDISVYGDRDRSRGRRD